MRRLLAITFFAALACIALARPTTAQDILRGTIYKLDVEQKQITVTIDGKQREFALDDNTRVFDASGDTLAEKLKGFKAGSNIYLKPTTRDGREVLEGIKLAEGARPEGAPANRPANNAGGGGPRNATVKKLDKEKKTVTLEADGKEIECQVTEQTRIHNAGEAKDVFALFKEGDKILFLARQGDDGQVLVGIAPAGGASQPGTPGQRVTTDTSALKPLTELGKEKYQGSMGGLYPNGENARPSAHEAAGLKLAAAIKPLDADGKPAGDSQDDSGRIVLLSIGMSNTSQLSDGFRQALAAAEGVNPRFLFVNGAQGGMTAAAIEDPTSGRGEQYWRVVDERLAQAKVTRQQVQAVWIKQADAGPNSGFPAYAKTLQEELGNIARIVHDRFPNAKLAFLSSRTYGGFATTRLNPEPYAYESGFSVKWLIEQQLDGDAELNYDASKGPVKAPWLSWGPYLWANGENKRAADGFSYEPSDFAGDGTHHAQSGVRKGGEQLLKFFRTDSATKGWFNAGKE